MITLALDLSTKSTGYAIYQDKRLVTYGCITATSTDLIARINKISKELGERVLLKYKIDRVVVEEVIPKEATTSGMKNLKTQRALMWMQAAIAFMLYSYDKKLDIEYLYPSEWRKKCGIKTGRGVRRDQQKPYDIQFVKEIYKIDVNDDIADAIGIGYAAVNSPAEINF